MAPLSEKSQAIRLFLASRFPSASCTLDFHNPFECLVSVILSAQTSDASVNSATPALFSAYPDAFFLAKATPTEVEPYLRHLGLYRNKAKSLVGMAQKLVKDYGGEVPLSQKELLSLPGVGLKVANVVLLEIAHEPHFPVDTHVGRVYKRLGYAKEEDSPEAVEKKLEKAFPRRSGASSITAPSPSGGKSATRKAPHAKNAPCGNTAVITKGARRLRANSRNAADTPP